MKLRPLYVTPAMLEKHGACRAGKTSVKRAFGPADRIPLTKANLRRAHKAGAPIGWLADAYNQAVDAFPHNSTGIDCPGCHFEARSVDTEGEWDAITTVRCIAEERGFYA